uniref:Uncharacterized protein n=1 Tax=Cacopsylla melanoneura TaxID=428564 RepID=A0A8D8XPB5_9HEMI
MAGIEGDCALYPGNARTRSILNLLTLHCNRAQYSATYYECFRFAQISNLRQLLTLHCIEHSPLLLCASDLTYWDRVHKALMFGRLTLDSGWSPVVDTPDSSHGNDIEGTFI